MAGQMVMEIPRWMQCAITVTELPLDHILRQINSAHTFTHTVTSRSTLIISSHIRWCSSRVLFLLIFIRNFCVHSSRLPRKMHVLHTSGLYFIAVTQYSAWLQTGRTEFDPRQRQWVPGVHSPGLNSGRSATLTTRPYLVPRSRTSRTYVS
jgi:hypothetical protein